MKDMITKDFTDLIRYLSKRRTLVHCEARDGYFSSKYGSDLVQSIDPFPQSPVYVPIIIDNYTTYTFSRKNVLLFIKPSKNDLVEKTISTNRRRVNMSLIADIPKKVTSIIKNLHSECTISVIGHWRGPNNERVFKFLNKPYSSLAKTEEIKNFHLVSYNLSADGKNNSFWVEKVSLGDRPYYKGPTGTYHVGTHLTFIKQLKTTTDKLDWTGTYLDRPNSSCGWVNPKGSFFGCPINEHYFYAKYLLKRDAIDLLKEGWIKILDKPNGVLAKIITDELYIALLDLTNEQKEWLKKNGYNR